MNVAPSVFIELSFIISYLFIDTYILSVS